MALSSLRTDDGINAGGYQNVFPPPCSLWEKGSVSWPGKAPSNVPAPIYTWLSVWSSLKTCLLLLVCLRLQDTRLWSTQPTLPFIHIKKESTRTHLLSLSLVYVYTHTYTRSNMRSDMSFLVQRERLFSDLVHNVLTFPSECITVCELHWFTGG